MLICSVSDLLLSVSASSDPALASGSIEVFVGKSMWGILTLLVVTMSAHDTCLSVVLLYTLLAAVLSFVE